jgi:WD40 repeat protein
MPSYTLFMANVTCSQSFPVHFQIWDIMTGNLIGVLLGRHNQAYITMADLSSNEDLLVLCSAGGSFLLLGLTLSPLEPYVQAQESYSFQLDDSIRSCKLSHDALLLALGQDNGNIIVSILDGVILRKFALFACLFVPFFPHVSKQ